MRLPRPLHVLAWTATSLAAKPAIVANMACAQPTDLDLIAPPGIKMGGFRILPNADVTVGYVDNIFAVDQFKVADAIFAFEPSLEIKSAWSRHELQTRFRLRREDYFDENGEDALEWRQEFRGRLDISRRSTFEAYGRYERQSEDRRNNNTTNANSVSLTLERVRFRTLELDTTAAHRINRIKVSVNANIREIDFDDAERRTGGIADEDIRDRFVVRSEMRAEQRWGPSLIGFARASFILTDYRNALPEARFDRDSEGFSGVAGARYEYGTLFRATAFAGVERRNFQDPVLDDALVPIFTIAGDWRPYRRTSFELRGSARLEETAFLGASSFQAYRARLRAERTITRFVRLAIEGSFVHDAFQGIERRDNQFTASLYAEYPFAPGFFLVTGYDYQYQNSTNDLQSFTRNSVSIGIEMTL